MSKFPPELVGVEPLLEGYVAMERKMNDPDLHSDQSRVRRVGHRYAELGRVAAAARAFLETQGDLETGREMAAEDPGFAAELPKLQEAFDTVQAALIEILTPHDPGDARDVIMEIKTGEGGEESALFARDLMRMYQHYAEKVGWAVQILGLTESDLGGVKDAQIAFKAEGDSAPEGGVWAHLEYGGGVHRIQRIPVAESQGRIHTSAAGVLVMPEAEETGDTEIDPSDLRIDVYCSSGPGGQSMSTTDSAVRITHLPTDIVVSMQDRKSQLQNREAEMRASRSRLIQLEQEKHEVGATEARASQVRTVDRSERIRTYNFPGNRTADHRTGYKACNLDAILNGELAPVIQSAIDAGETARLAVIDEKQRKSRGISPREQ